MSEQAKKSLTDFPDDGLAPVVGLIVGTRLQILGAAALTHALALALVAHQVVLRRGHQGGCTEQERRS